MSRGTEVMRQVEDYWWMLYRRGFLPHHSDAIARTEESRSRQRAERLPDARELDRLAARIDTGSSSPPEMGAWWTPCASSGRFRCEAPHPAVEEMFTVLDQLRQAHAWAVTFEAMGAAASWLVRHRCRRQAFAALMRRVGHHRGPELIEALATENAKESAESANLSGGTACTGLAAKVR